MSEENYPRRERTIYRVREGVRIALIVSWEGPEFDRTPSALDLLDCRFGRMHVRLPRSRKDHCIENYRDLNEPWIEQSKNAPKEGPWMLFGPGEDGQRRHLGDGAFRTLFDRTIDRLVRLSLRRMARRAERGGGARGRRRRVRRPEGRELAPPSAPLL